MSVTTSENGTVRSASSSVAGHWIAAMAAGSIAGGCGIFVGHPFDSLKVRMQVGKTLEYKRFDLSVLKQLYRGLSTPMLTVGTLSAINFSMYEQCKSYLVENQEDSPSTLTGRGKWTQQLSHSMLSMGDTLDCPPLEDSQLSSYPTTNDGDTLTGTYKTTLSTVFYSGVISGAISTFISNPLSVLKIQMQVASEAGLYATVRQIYGIHGVQSFYRGYPAHCISESFGRGVYLWTYEAVKAQVHHLRALLRSPGAEQLRLSDYLYSNDVVVAPHVEVDLSTRIIAAACAGVFSWFAIYPADVVKARVQLDLERKTYRSVWHCVGMTFREAGIRGMFRGLTYTLIRAAPVAGTVLPIYDLVKKMVEDRLQ
jgi:hypothetical protein